MHFFITVFLSLINLMINKYTSYIIALQFWNTAVRQNPAETENCPHCKRKFKTTTLYTYLVYLPPRISKLSNCHCKKRIFFWMEGT